MEDQTSRELVFGVSWRHYWHGQKDFDTNTTKEGSIIIPRHGGDRQQNECKSIGITTVDAEQEHTRSLPTMTGASRSTEYQWMALASERFSERRLICLSAYHVLRQYPKLR